MTQSAPDLRPVLARSQDRLTDLVRGLDADRLTRPTPCEGWSVADLVEHLLAVEGRVAALPARGDVEGLPTRLPLPEGDLGDAFAAAVEEARQEWSDDAVLDRELSPPWGTMPGRAVLGGYVMEHLAHGWDLAVAIDEDPEALADVAAQVLPVAQQNVPAHIRDEDWVPFGPVVEPAADAGPTEQLANWLGRTTR